MRVLVGLLLVSTFAGADALVVTRAMKATTIAEVFVEADAVRVELEIGVPDLKAFRDVLPDELYTRLGFEAEPLAARLERFFREGWVMTLDGKPRAPDVKRLLGRRRVRRDEITGVATGEEEEPVVFVELRYRLATTPAILALRSPGSVGFVLYHEGVAVNDFRYLAGEVTVDLDWTDPWFSRFRGRNLRRRYDAPLNAFLYIDHFEVRKEIICRPRDLGFDLGDVIAVKDQEALKRKVAAFLVPKSPVTIDGKEVEGELDRIHFVQRTLRSTGVVDPPADLPSVSATLGVIFVYPIAALPQEVAMRWDLFPPRVQQVPAVATDEAGGMPSVLTPDDPVLTWTNFLKHPTEVPAFIEIPPPPERRLPLASFAVGVVALVLFARRRWAVGAVLVVAAALLWPRARPPAPDAQAIVAGLLENTYRAFDHRAEGVIYDTLARSVSGELLTQTYLETRRMLELANQGGARAKVRQVEIVSAETTDLEEGFSSRCTWNVTGSVGHWGHIHQRRNRYEAVFTVEPVDGAWKITGLELLNEQRL